MSGVMNIISNGMDHENNGTISSEYTADNIFNDKHIEISYTKNVVT